MGEPGTCCYCGSAEGRFVADGHAHINQLDCIRYLAEQVEQLKATVTPLVSEPSASDVGARAYA